MMLALAFALALPLATRPVLELPWACGEAHACTQANGGQASHTGVATYAWDFGLPRGTDILAARGGTVLRIEMDSRVGGCSHVYAHDANYVLIDHQDGTAALYLHVEGGSSNLQVGDAVATGDVIARVGQSGWSCGPHLHFQVQEICGSWWCQSVPSEFRSVAVIAEREQVVSENCGANAATWTGGGRCDPGASETDGICASDETIAREIEERGGARLVRVESRWSDAGLGSRHEAGCACASSSDPRGAWLGLLALAGLGRARRRQR